MRQNARVAEDHPEQRARRQIDGMLTAAGWAVQDRAAMNLAAAGVAIRELQTSAGPADYMLFLGNLLVGVVEAKKAGVTLSTVEAQTRDYASKAPKPLQVPVRPLPFLYESTGVETWFTNGLDPGGPADSGGGPRARRVFSFHRPETLRGWLDAALDRLDGKPGAPAAATLKGRMRLAPPLDATGMWPAQARAVANLEASFRDGRPRALVQMATGSGKTFTAIAALYRLIRHGGARRVLFLVDRGNLGRQALKEFQAYTTPDDGRKLTELYNVANLTHNKVDPVNKVVITTIQRLYSILQGEETFDETLEEGSAFTGSGSALVREPPPVVYSPYLPPEFFDVVVVDECHRSIYTLWRQVLEYFDATLIGLTATPASHTYAFFHKNVVSEYTHTQAVRDRVNVPFQVYEIATRVTAGGANVVAEGDTVVGKRDRLTRKERWEVLDEDFSYAGKDLDRSVVVPDQIRTVLRELRSRRSTRPAATATRASRRGARPTRTAAGAPTSTTSWSLATSAASTSSGCATTTCSTPRTCRPPTSSRRRSPTICAAPSSRSTESSSISKLIRRIGAQRGCVRLPAALWRRDEMSPEPARNPDNLTVDRAALYALIQTAVDVELFTIPLYMTALYSLRGTYPAPFDGQNAWPGLRPDPTSTVPTQRAYNAIFSVYVQEMLHLQLAGNLASAMGWAPFMNAPVYDGTSVPCIGDLKDMAGYEDVVVRLGPLDRNQIRLFLAIENPDWESSSMKPKVPFAGWRPGQPLPQFGTIGHLYECIREYMDLSYGAGTETYTLWEKVYDPSSIQIDLFNFESDTDYHPEQEYPTFDVFFPPGISASLARGVADTMIDAITEQGEGRDASKGPDTVDPMYVPSEKGVSDDYNSNDGAVRFFWDQQGHFERFQQVARWLAEVETWPQWWTKRGGVFAWQWQDLVVAPAVADEATRTFAEQRADALNDPRTADEVNDALDQSYSSLLVAIEASWRNPAWLNRKDKQIDADQLFPYAAMQALATRVAAVWAANGVPRFLKVSTSGTLPFPDQPAHACQGLDPDNPGLNTCANAVIHTCSQANSCKHQGGCGYPTPPDSFPSVNTDSGGGGGCGAPIPVAQVFNRDQSGPPWTYNGVDPPIPIAAGDNVWDTAWKIFQAVYPQAQKATPPAPTNLRLVLPPS